ncbi:FtsW/RodA/SpoVE family cell cycle protein [Latilactobacillus fragifolii]|uniref:FtsW/RodA/SpoVE family cell cycle protein n=1 Tax=Latilactobacillus fragifolii TaxID=2814244 RepID=UPI001ABA1A8A|nr:FtsW/RodA/SpoVE family cell cycle protein [Latilactobacillus fragifolii]
MRINHSILWLIAILTTIGCISIYYTALYDGQNAKHMVMMQVIWLTLSGATVFIMTNLTDEQLFYLAIPMLDLTLLLLVATLFLYNKGIYLQTGAKDWLAIGGVSLEPCEFVKPFFILYVARAMTIHDIQAAEPTMKSDWLFIVKIMILVLPLLFVLHLQHNLGTALAFMIVTIIMLISAKLTWQTICIITLMTLSIVLVSYLMFVTKQGQNILMHLGFKIYQFKRLDAWLNPSSDPSGNHYQVTQSMNAIGYGNLSGHGFNHLHISVPVRESDMLFSTIGEATGYLGTTFVIAVYLLLIVCFHRMAIASKNIFLSYYIIGYIVLLTFHIFENIGMNIGIMPLTGIPLPFISQGGSALLSNFISIGIILSLGKNKTHTIFDDKQHWHINFLPPKIFNHF